MIEKTRFKKSKTTIFSKLIITLNYSCYYWLADIVSACSIQTILLQKIDGKRIPVMFYFLFYQHILSYFFIIYLYRSTLILLLKQLNHILINGYSICMKHKYAWGDLDSYFMFYMHFIYVNVVYTLNLMLYR